MKLAVWGWLIAAGLCFAAASGLRTLAEREDAGLPWGWEMDYVPDRRVWHAAALADDGTAADLLWLRCVFYLAGAGFEDKQREAAGLPPCPRKGFRHHHENEDLLPALVKMHAGQIRVSNERVGFADYDFRSHPVIRAMLMWNLGSSDVPHLKQVLDIVTDLDPKFQTPYVQGALNLAIMAGRPDEAIALLDKAVAKTPDLWQVWYYRGFVRLFYRNDKTGAASDLKAAAMRTGALPLAVQLAYNLEANLSGLEVARKFLEGVYATTGDPRMRETIEQTLKGYFGGGA